MDHRLIMDTHVDLDAFCAHNAISIARLAELLLTPLGTVRNWCDNRRKPPKCLPLALAYLQDHPELLIPKPRKVRTPKVMPPLPDLPPELRWKPPSEE